MTFVFRQIFGAINLLYYSPTSKDASENYRKLVLSDFGCSLLAFIFVACWYSVRHTESKSICSNINDKGCRGSPVVIGWLSPKLQICFI